MTKQEILNTLLEMSKYQGFYGRLLESIKEDPSYLDFLEQQNFMDRMDLILYLEGE